MAVLHDLPSTNRSEHASLGVGDEPCFEAVAVIAKCRLGSRPLRRLPVAEAHMNLYDSFSGNSPTSFMKSVPP